MTVFKKSLCAVLGILACTGAYAQSDTPIPSINSPYSMYGLGTLNDQSMAKGRAMGGVGYAIQDPAEINLKNPASYAAVDSLTMLVDVGFSMYTTNLSDGVSQASAKNAAFDYIAMQFRLCKGLGLSIAYLPFSKVGYNFYTSSSVDNSTAPDYSFGTNTYTYKGYGGLQQVMLGLGVRPFRGFSLGVNASYLYGSIDRTLSISSSSSSAYGFTKTESMSVKDYKLDFGLQYNFRLKEKHSLTLGLVYTMGHEMNIESYDYYMKTSSSSIVSYETDSLPGRAYLPHMFGGGIAYNFDNRLTVSADYVMQKWGDNLFLGNGSLRNKGEYHFGAEYLYDEKAKNYFGRIKYRLGCYYSEPYVTINGLKGAKEFGVSFGFGLPVLQNRSIVQVSGQYVRVSSQNQKVGLDENMFKLNIGITFNERWFMKMKVR